MFYFFAPFIVPISGAHFTESRIHRHPWYLRSRFEVQQRLASGDQCAI